MPIKHLTLFAALFALSPSLAAADTLHRSGPSQDRLDLVILADGFRANDRSEFTDAANELWAEMKRTEPFSRYQSLMNVHTGFRASPRNGPGSDNNYGLRFTGGFLSPLLQASRTTLLLQDAVTFGGDADVVIVLLNSNRRGGTAVGNICFASVGPGPRLAIHELGHALGRLGDEYSGFSGTPTLTRAQMSARYPNLTTAATREQLPWKAWVASSTRVPAGLFSGGGVSAYKGGGAYSSGLYRPKRRCRMRTDGPGFCEVCRQHLVIQLHKQSNPLSLAISGSGNSRRARLASPLPDSTWATRWSGVQASGVEARVPAGVNAAVVVEDATPWVRGDFRADIRYRFNARTGAGGPVTTGSAGQAARVVGVNTRLRVRSGPSTGNAILGHLQPGASVRVLGAAVNGFYPISFGGRTGYAGANFIRLTSSPAGLARLLVQ